MREIKFRAWDKKNKKMLHYDNDVTPCITLNGVCQGENHTNVSFDYVLMQYTGLKDKNGKEIYEGDRLNHSIDRYQQECPYVVEDMSEFYKELNRSDTYYRIDEYSLEIIGNIHENPELLEKENE